MSIDKFIRPIHELDTDELTAGQKVSIAFSNKKYLLMIGDQIHLSNNPKKLVKENYTIRDAYGARIYSLRDLYE